jgi:hypothetical protein
MALLGMDMDKAIKNTCNRLHKKDQDFGRINKQKSLAPDEDDTKEGDVFSAIKKKMLQKNDETVIGKMEKEIAILNKEVKI